MKIIKTHNMELQNIFYFGNGGWGNACYYIQNDGVENENRVYGWKPFRFESNTTCMIALAGCHENDVPIKLLYNVQFERDPQDMFFADCKTIGYIPIEIARKGGMEAQNAVKDVYDQYWSAKSTPKSIWKKICDWFNDVQ